RRPCARAGRRRAAHRGARWRRPAVHQGERHRRRRAGRRRHLRHPSAPEVVVTMVVERSCPREEDTVLTGIDHMVVVVPDLDIAIKNYRDLGFTVVPGGRHPIGTHNALIGFADGAYLELIAFFEPDTMHRWRSALTRGGGLVDYCM